MKTNKNNRYLLIAAAVCVLAVGVGTFTALHDSAGRAVKADITTEKAEEAFTLTAFKPEKEEGKTEQTPGNKQSGTPEIPGDEFPRAVREEETPTGPNDETGFVLPLGTGITKDFSAGEPVYSATMRDWRAHNGVDFGAALGTAVRSACGGTVSDISKDEFWGNVVEISITESVTARFCGLEKVAVQKEDKVSPGDVIGTLGTVPVESADGPHLHFEIISESLHIDPLAFLGLDGETEETEN